MNRTPRRQSPIVGQSSDVAAKTAALPAVAECLDLLERLMRLRRVDTQSELFRALLAEDDERFASLAALRATAGAVARDAFDAQLP